MDAEALNRESRAIWEQNAAIWDTTMGDEGGTWQRTLIAPVTERLLAVQPGERVLDIACGNGAFARRLASLGATVVASDFSSQLIARAQTYPVPGPGSVTYHVADATAEAELLALGPGPFDAAVSTMALMDMPVIAPLLRAVRQLLRPDGRFVFSVTHPCFNTLAVAKIATGNEVDGEYQVQYALQIHRYLSGATGKGVALRGQPALQYYWDRPLSVLFTTCFQAGFVLDAFEEPPISTPPGGTFDWANFGEFPPVLIARLRTVQEPR